MVIEREVEMIKPMVQENEQLKPANDVVSKTDRIKGLILVSMMLIGYSPDGLFTKLCVDEGASPFNLAYLKYFPVAVVFVMTSILHSWCQTKQIVDTSSIEEPKGKMSKKYLILGTVFATGCNISYTVAFSYATAAAALSFAALAPIWAAFGAKFILGERLPMITVFVSFGVFLGMVVSCTGYFVTDHEDELWEILLGVASGFSAGLSFAGFLLTCRSAAKFAETTNMLYSTFYSLIATSLIGVVSSLVVDGEIYTGNTNSIIYGVVYGLFFLPIAFLGTTLAPKFLVAAEIGVLVQLEAIIAPILTLIALDEVPTIYTIIGGSIILIAVFIHEASGLPMMQNTCIVRYV